MAEDPKKDPKETESSMIKWKKPNGVEIETNRHPDNIKEAKRLKWKPVK